MSNHAGPERDVTKEGCDKGMQSQQSSYGGYARDTPDESKCQLKLNRAS